MRFWFFPLLLLAAQTKAADWQLVWSDEFNGSKLDYAMQIIDRNTKIT